MGVPLLPDFTRWSPQELRKAEAAAMDFLNEHIVEIAQTFEKRLKLIRRVSARMTAEDACFEERMLCLSVIRELSQSLEQSASEFFEIGCQPAVAKLVRDA